MRALAFIAIALAQAIYAVFKLTLRPRHKVVMLSRQSDRPSRDFTLLAAELTRRDPSLQIIVRCRFIKRSLLARITYVTEVLAQMYHLATARVAIVDGYLIPVSVLDHRSDLRIIQMWHSLGAIKSFGYQSLDRPGGRTSKLARAFRMHRNYDVVLCGGPTTVPVFAEAFDTPASKVAPLGLPRVDFLADRGEAHEAAAASVLELFDRLADTSKIRVLYAPTFRKGGATGFQAVLAAFDPERFTLVVKPHDLEPQALDSPHIVDATGVSVLDVLHVVDAVVTDYSGAAFEGACAGKPVYLYLYDLDEYARDHGVNMDLLAEFGADASRTIDPLVERIAAREHDQARAAVFREHYLPPLDGRCTATIAQIVFDDLEHSEGARS